MFTRDDATTVFGHFCAATAAVFMSINKQWNFFLIILKNRSHLIRCRFLKIFTFCCHNWRTTKLIWIKNLSSFIWNEWWSKSTTKYYLGNVKYDECRKCWWTRPVRKKKTLKVQMKLEIHFLISKCTQCGNVVVDVKLF